MNVLFMSRSLPRDGIYSNLYARNEREQRHREFPFNCSLHCSLHTAMPVAVTVLTHIGLELLISTWYAL